MAYGRQKPFLGEFIVSLHGRIDFNNRRAESSDPQRKPDIRVHWRGGQGDDLPETDAAVCGRGHTTFLLHDAAEGGGKLKSWPPLE